MTLYKKQTCIVLRDLVSYDPDLLLLDWTDEDDPELDNRYKYYTNRYKDAFVSVKRYDRYVKVKEE